MPIYLMTTSKGKRIVQAETQKSAINHVMRSEIEIEPLNAVALANVLREEGLQIEQVASRKDGDEAKIDTVEDPAEDAEEE